jgi:hypothetical protein
MAQLQATTAGTVSATTFSGSGASLTALSASNVSGTWNGARLWSGCVVRTHVFTNSTRTAPGASADATLYSWSITKQFSSSESNLVVHGLVPTRGDPNGGEYHYFSVNGSRRYTGINDNTFGAEVGGYDIMQIWTGISSGTVNFAQGWHPNDGTAQLPFSIANTNNSDDGRNRQLGSVFVIYEVRT